MFLTQKLKQKTSKIEKKHKGSALAFSLIIIAMMLTIAVGVVSTSLVQKKNVTSTESSIQAYQISDGSALWALKKINTAIYNNATVASQFSTCSGGIASGLTDNISTLGSTASFDLYFLKADDTTLVACSDPASSVLRIKSVGKFQNTVRAVNITVLTKPDPIAWWKMDESTGTTTADASGNGHTGTLTNGPTRATGKIGNAVNFDGINDYISIGSLGGFPAQGTLDFWINSAEMNDYRNPLATGSINVGIRFEENAAGAFGMVTGDDAGSYMPQPILSGMQTNKWYHVAYTWNTTTNTETRYIDGVQIFSGTQTHWPSSLSNFRIGTGFDNSAQRSWKGLVDDVRLYNYARTSQQVTQDMMGS